LTQTEKICWLVDLGVISYASACELQQRLVEARKARAIPDVLLLCEHPPVITMGRNARPEHLLASNRRLAEMKIELRSTDRGGDITYHGPGQIIGYPVLDLTEHRRDVLWYVEQLEEVMIRTTADFGLTPKRVEGQHGVWIRPAEADEKLGAIGVHLSRWITSHGFAYNVSTDLRYFDLIVPCGIADKGATSLERALGRPIGINEVRDRIVDHFAAVFGVDVKKVDIQELVEVSRTTPTTAVL
jgi:lipoyl(octanoyl) transferase